MPFSAAFNAFMRFYRDNGNAFNNQLNDVCRLGGLWSFAKPPDWGGGGDSCQPQTKKAEPPADSAEVDSMRRQLTAGQQDYCLTNNLLEIFHATRYLNAKTFVFRCQRDFKSQVRTGRPDGKK
jgi:hypothetical protein